MLNRIFRSILYKYVLLIESLLKRIYPFTYILRYLKKNLKVFYFYLFLGYIYKLAN